jgi:hypothetical protein
LSSLAEGGINQVAADAADGDGNLRKLRNRRTQVV